MHRLATLMVFLCSCGKPADPPDVSYMEAMRALGRTCAAKNANRVYSTNRRRRRAGRGAPYGQDRSGPPGGRRNQCRRSSKDRSTSPEATVTFFRALLLSLMLSPAALVGGSVGNGLTTPVELAVGGKVGNGAAEPQAFAVGVKVGNGITAPDAVAALGQERSNGVATPDDGTQLAGNSKSTGRGATQTVPAQAA